MLIGCVFLFGVFPTLLVSYLVFLIFFERGLAYRVEKADIALGSEAFFRVLSGVTGSPCHRGGRIEPLLTGQAFYDAQVAAIEAATDTVHLEQYIFEPGSVGSRFLAALTACAHRGVRVRVTLDYAGSFGTSDSFFAPLRDAGGTVRWYQAPRWFTFKHLTNRTHRKLLVVDGKVGFVGGAGVADAWLQGIDGAPAWRDTMFRVEGGLVTGLQTCFSENWVEAGGEILVRQELFPPPPEPAANSALEAGLVVISSPQAGRSTPAHVTYMLLIEGARRSIDITTPYFLPDIATQAALRRACERGVRVRVMTAGTHTDQRVARASARGRYGELLRAGGHVFEYRPAMLHTKAMVVDGTWSVIGSTNLDNRSFALNDEVIVVARDPSLVASLDAVFSADIRECEQVTLDAWRHRPLLERVIAPVAQMLDRQS